MRIKLRVLRKTISVLSSILLLINSFSPYLLVAPVLVNQVKAQEATVTPTQEPTPTETLSPTPTTDPTISPTETISPTPTVEITPTVEVTPVETIAPTEVPVLPPTEAPSVPSPPQTTGQINLSPTGETTPTPTPAIMSLKTDGHVETTLAESYECRADSLNGCLITDKADYAPTDIAIITGHGFAPSTIYILYIYSDNLSVSYQITTDSTGSFTYSYQLDGTYRPNYLVELKDQAGNLAASVTFTDSATEIEYNNFEGEIALNGSNNWTNGNISGYKEGDYIRFRLDLDSQTTTPSVTGHLFIGFTSNPTCRFFAYENPTNIAVDFDRTTNNIDSGTGFTASLSGLSQSGNDAIADFLLSADSNKQVRLNFTLRLADGAAGCASGSSQHVQVDHTSGAVKSSGNKALPIPANAVAPVTDVTISKTAPLTKSIGQSISYSLTVTNLDPSTTASNVIVTDTLPSGIAFSSGSWTKTNPSGSGTCSAIGQAVTCNIGDLAGGSTSSITINGTVNNDTQLCSTTQTNNANVSTTTLESDYTNNSAQANTDINPCVGTLSIHKQDQDGASMSGVGFAISGASSASGSTDASGNLVFSNIPTGAYTVTETEPTDYHWTSTSGNCTNANPASVTVTNAGQSCTFINTRNTGTLQVLKNVDLNGDGDYTDTNEIGATDWKWQANAGSDHNTGDTAITVNTGDYALTETPKTDFHQVSLSCTGGTLTSNSVAVATGANVVCTFVNALDTGTIVVHKDVQGPNGEDVTDNSNYFEVSLDTGTGQTISDNITVTYNDVPVGSHTITESLIDTDYTLYGISTVAGTSGNINGLTINVTTGTNDVYVTNRQKSGTVTVIKDVVNPDGGAISDSHSFTANLNPGGQSSSFAEGSNAVFTVNPGTYTVSESADPDYTNLGCLTVTGKPDPFPVVSGGQVTITCTNQQKKATITVIKDVTKSDGSTVDDNHLFHVTLNSEIKDLAENTNAVFTVNPGGPYGALESPDSNYTLVSQDGAVTVGSNGSATINIVNKQNPGTISGYKYKADGVTGILGWVIDLYSCVSSGVDCDTFISTTSTDSSGFFSFSNLVTGFYQVREFLDNLFTPVGNTSHDVTVNPGTVSNNNDFANFKNINITVCKKEDPDGSLDTPDDQSPLSGWTMTLTSGGEKVGTTQTTDLETGCTTFSNLGPGRDYSVTETLENGWTNLTDLTHDFGTPVDGVDQSFTFINFENLSISGQKFNDLNGDGVKVSGEPGLAGWTINLDKNSDGSVDATTTTDGSGNYSFTDLGPGTYRLREVNQSGWAQTTTNPNDIIVTSGQDVTGIDFGNQVRGTITIVKDSVPNDGQDFSFTGDFGAFNLDDDADSTLENTQVFSGLANGIYDVTEGLQSGWTLTDLVCSGDTDSRINLETRTATLTINQPNENIICTFTNSRRPKLTVIKHVVTDNGGTAVAANFTINVTGTNVSDSSFPGNESGTIVTLDPGTYSADENENLNYAKTLSADCAGTLSYGDNKTCTITNDDIPAHLIVIKHVINDNGGTAVAGNFNMTISGVTATGGNSFAGVENPGTDKTLTTLGTYNVSETGPSGYTESDSADCTGTIALGETKTCTITNDDNTPSLTLVKQVINNDGGNALASAWTLTATGPTEFSGAGPSVSNGASFDAGTYDLSESGPDNYSTNNWVCVGVTQDDSDTVTLGLGQSATCTIVNDDQAPKLKLVKQVITDNGGAAVADSWTLSADADSPDDGRNFSNLGGSGAFENVFANAGYDLAESNVPGYTANSWSCDGGTLIGSEITLGLNEDVTCTITNDDIQPKLTVIKQIIGGNATTDDFDYFVVNNTGATQVQHNQQNSFDAGTYQVTETNNSGEDYTATFSSGDCDSEGYVTLTVGGPDKSCTITNTRDLGSLEVNKQVDTDGDGVFEGGNTEANSLGFVWGINTETPARAMGSTATSLETGSFDVNENDVSDYHFVGWFNNDSDYSCEEPEFTDLPASVDVNKDITTSITLCNARDTGTITVDKVTDPSGAVDEFTINLNQGLAGDPTLIHSSVLADQTNPDSYIIPTGEYWFEELAKDGWDLTNAKCTDGEIAFDPRGDQFTLEKDVELVCTFTNTQRGKVIVTKYSDNNGNGTKDGGEDVLSGWVMKLKHDENTIEEPTDVNGEATFNNLLPGGYILSEIEQENWILTNMTCSSNEDRLTDLIEKLNNSNQAELTVYPGETTTCEIGNQPINPELQISKSNNGTDNSQGGTVIYTLTVRALNSQVLGVFVKDLLPKGFTFQNVISIIKNGVEDITAAVGDPHYSSPGTYNLGNMNADDEIVIKYQAKIDGSQPFGLYKDVAWAEGKDLLDNKVLASAQTEGYVDNYFVGTAVRVNGTLTEEGNTDIGEVLGASTSLPATGASPVWLILALLLSVLGAISVATGLMFKKRKLNMIFKKLFIVLLLVAAWSIVSGSVFASDISVRLSEPKTPTRINYFTIDYVALDQSGSGSNLNIKCYYKKNLGDGWTQYGPDITLSAPGNSGSCQDVSPIVNTSETTYYFMVNANGIDSETVSVTYDSREPGAPTNYHKEKNGCEYKIFFKTADDAQTQRVEIYRSESTTMALNGSTKVADINIGPNTEGTFSQTVSDCNKTYYYVVRAFNTAGNASNPIGDSVTISTASTTTTEGAIPVTNVTLPSGGGTGEGGGSVLGEETKEGTEEAQKKEEVINVKDMKVTGSILGAITKKENRVPVVIASVIGLGIIGYGAYYFLKKRKENPQV